MSLDERDGDEVVIGRPGEATMSFGRPDAATDGSGLRLPVRLSTGEVSALTAIELEAWSGGPLRLVAYFDGLADAWRGWVGAKEWVDDGPSISMSATHDGVGLISLSVSAAPFAGWDGPGSWELRVVVPVEPGSLASITHELRLLLARTG